MLKLAPLLLLMAILTACSDSEAHEEEPDFLAKVNQTATSRLIKGTLHAVDSLNLSDYDVFEARHVQTDEQWIYVSDWGLGKVIAINKQQPSSYHFIGSGKGEGPGEVSGIANFTLTDQYLYWNAGNKLVKWTKEGTLVADHKLDIRPYRVIALSDEEFISVFPFSSDFLFHILDAEGVITRGFVKTDLEKHIPLQYEGIIAIDDHHLYYAGVPEPLIKKYTLDGDLVFSVSTIDNHPSEVNYVEFGTGGSGKAMGYAPGAYMSSQRIKVYDSYCLVIPIHDYDHTFLSYIDIYDAMDGTYLESYDLHRIARSLTVEENRIYTLEFEGKDTYVKVYDNLLATSAN